MNTLNSKNSDYKVIVGISGGVDSAVSAYLLKEQGYQVEGLFMKNWDEDDSPEYCSAEVDLADAEQVCEVLDIPLGVVNFSFEYWDRVFEYFLEEYNAGRTPNPDIMCNKEIKFRAFLDFAMSKGADFIATGHYVRSHKDEQVVKMLKGKDGNKDQSYFLYALNQEQVSKAIFPLGSIEKSEVRDIASKLGFDNADKKDSTGICFIGERKFTDFLNRYLPANPGNIISDNGTLLGQHNGLMFHTIGQRKGLNIGGRADASEAPWYVYDKDVSTNELRVCQGVDNALMFTDTLKASQLTWIADNAPSEKFKAQCKVRYRQPDQSCQVHIEDEQATVFFDEPQRAITRGQSVVFYDGDVCLGGGIIDDTWNVSE